MTDRNKSAPTGADWQSTEKQGAESSASTGTETKSSKTQNPPDRSSGAGSEAAEGLHAVGGRDQTDKTAATSRETVGSEPVVGRSTEHKGSYGGEGGKPRTSSNQREPSK